MKQIKLLLFAILIVTSVTGLTSCEKRNIDAGEGFTEFNITLPAEISGLKSAELTDSTNGTWQLMLSVEDAEGKPVFTDKLIPLYTFGTGYVSEKVEIPSGDLRLTKFMVINTSGIVIYASPVAGSPLAYLTNKPLPLPFKVVPGEVTRVVPEVLQVGDLTPDKFGYAAFGVNIIKPLVFFAGAVIDNPMIMAPFPLWTDAKLTVWAGNTLSKDAWHYSFKLEPGVNRIVVRGGFEFYSLIVEKENFFPQKFVFPAKVLMESAKDRPIYLRIPWDAVPMKSITIQPGPAEGKDAMISNLQPDKNFGGHKYFEATFLTEPVLTVMRSNRSLIFFNFDTLPKFSKIKKVTLKLTYDLPIPFDPVVFKPDQYPVPGIKWYGGALQQIVEPWEENKVTWNNQPATIEANQVLLAPFNRNTNIIEIDVTRLFVPMAEIAAPNHGIMFRLWPEDNFPGFRFASSDYPEGYYRPALTVWFTN